MASKISANLEHKLKTTDLSDKYSENIDKLLRENYAKAVPKTQLLRMVLIILC